MAKIWTSISLTLRSSLLVVLGIPRSNAICNNANFCEDNSNSNLNNKTDVNNNGKSPWHSACDKISATKSVRFGPKQNAPNCPFESACPSLSKVRSTLTQGKKKKKKDNSNKIQIFHQKDADYCVPKRSKLSHSTKFCTECATKKSKGDCNCKTEEIKRMEFSTRSFGQQVMTENLPNYLNESDKLAAEQIDLKMSVDLKKSSTFSAAKSDQRLAQCGCLQAVQNKADTLPICNCRQENAPKNHQNKLNTCGCNTIITGSQSPIFQQPYLCENCKVLLHGFSMIKESTEKPCKCLNCTNISAACSSMALHEEKNKCSSMSVRGEQNKCSCTCSEKYNPSATSYTDIKNTLQPSSRVAIQEMTKPSNYMDIKNKLRPISRNDIQNITPEISFLKESKSTPSNTKTPDNLSPTISSYINSTSNSICQGQNTKRSDISRLAENIKCPCSHCENINTLVKPLTDNSKRPSMNGLGTKIKCSCAFCETLKSPVSSFLTHNTSQKPLLPATSTSVSQNPNIYERISKDKTISSPQILKLVPIKLSQYKWSLCEKSGNSQLSKQQRLANNQQYDRMVHNNPLEMMSRNNQQDSHLSFLDPADQQTGSNIGAIVSVEPIHYQNRNTDHMVYVSQSDNKAPEYTEENRIPERILIIDERSEEHHTTQPASSRFPKISARPIPRDQFYIPEIDFGYSNLYNRN